MKGRGGEGERRREEGGGGGGGGERYLREVVWLSR